MTAIIDRVRQVTMCGDEVNLRSTFIAPSTSLAAGEVYFALPAWAPHTHQPKRRPRLRASLFDSVARLVELMPNWDGYGGKVPSAGAVKMAVRFLAAMPDWVPDPQLLPATDGTVLLEWDRRGVELLLSLGDRGLDTAVVAIDGGDELEGPANALQDQILDALVALAERP